MRILLNDIKLADDYLQGQLPSADKLLLEANILLDANLAGNVDAQARIIALAQSYGRQQLKVQLNQIHRQLFTEPQHRSFAQKIRSIFNRI